MRRRASSSMKSASRRDRRAYRLRDLADASTRERRGDAHLAHELGRRQPQRRECALTKVILAVILTSERIPRRVRRGTGGVCTLKRGAKAPREVLPSVSQLS